LLHVDRPSAHDAPENTGGGLTARIAHYRPYALAILRIVAALLFFEHGLAKLTGFPRGPALPVDFNLHWFSGVIEFIGGALLAAGLFSRVVALIVSGEMAVAYFLSHAPRGFFPLLNGGEAAILFCFVFLYLVFAGPGAWSLDALWSRKRG
jgi:putative oxidoreductase